MEDLEAEQFKMSEENICNENGNAIKSQPSGRPATQQRDAVLKVIMLGEAGVGKTTFARRIQTRDFSPSTAVTYTLDIFQRKILLASGTMMTFALWDTAGQERCRSLTYSYYRDTKGVLVMYDEKTKLRISDLLKDLKQYAKDCKVSVFLIANKIDLGRDFVLSDNEIEDLSKLNGVLVVDHFMVSSLTGENVEACFRTIAKRLWDAEEMKQFEESSKSTTIKLQDKSDPPVEKTMKKNCAC
ncbi:ras-related protein Rab-1-like [Littorina saxatilis]|uniref:ras-related protein Rab-1-like n=1 Tax=Littorina saxatilis TaxID=31220 RepID=UPI0038B47705